jgi:hypothetical protein
VFMIMLDAFWHDYKGAVIIILLIRIFESHFSNWLCTKFKMYMTGTKSLSKLYLRNYLVLNMVRLMVSEIKPKFGLW